MTDPNWREAPPTARFLEDFVLGARSQTSGFTLTRAGARS